MTDFRPRRAVTALGLLGIALIHLLDLPGKLKETLYLGAAYILLIVASVGVAEYPMRRRDRRARPAATVLAAAVLLGCVVNRSVGLPGAMDDIGNWLEPLGPASVFVEAVVVVLGLSGLVDSMARGSTDV
ncbi:hypothetical protein [Streptomyces broussonetiae]|uniref:Uncharacterized protein n=1 Tax=Streptomyces broussonetiae TaxID=2686304 RepID=A0A6I6NAC1_9ACTN|nr:hypothetical protein [Streptomyces broussonetiae]QHA05286.1 hypothetical protein GQF42_20090 [Streptomyces broussonetiae]